MSRLPISKEQDGEYQKPILDALDDYFDTVYTPNSPMCSVGSAASSTADDRVLLYSAFRVSKKHIRVVLQFLETQSQLFANEVAQDET